VYASLELTATRHHIKETFGKDISRANDSKRQRSFINEVSFHRALSRDSPSNLIER